LAGGARKKFPAEQGGKEAVLLGGDNNLIVGGGHPRKDSQQKRPFQGRPSGGSQRSQGLLETRKNHEEKRNSGGKLVYQRVK